MNAPSLRADELYRSGMSSSLAQTIVIENIAGAAGTIGAGCVARAAPDGYTLSGGFLGTHVLNGAIYISNMY
jgi:tripartite-type tricarboxylate transporter receptor subunit TctC